MMGRRDLCCPRWASGHTVRDSLSSDDSLLVRRREEPILQIYVFFQGSTGTFSQEQNMSLWDAGNLFIKAARNIVQNMEANYGLSTNNSLAFQNNTDVLYIVSTTHGSAPLCRAPLCCS